VKQAIHPAQPKGHRRSSTTPAAEATDADRQGRSSRFGPSGKTLATAPLCHVLHVIYGLKKGGTERDLTELVLQMDPARFRSCVVTGLVGGYYHDRLLQSGIEVLHFPFRHLYGVHAFRQYVRLARLIRRRHIDILQGHDVGANIITAVAGLLARHRAVLMTRRDIGETYWRPSHRLLQAGAYRFARRVIVNAEALFPLVCGKERVPRQKVVRIYNGVDTDQFCPGPPPAGLRQELGLKPSGPVVAVVANLHPKKDHATFLRAAARLTKSFPDASFLVVGQGETRPEVEALAGELGLTDRVRFTGERHDIPEILRLSDVYVLTSLSEAFPNAIIEAMATEVPVVATNVGGISESVLEGETGYLVSPRDDATFADRIGRLLRDREQARAMGTAARRVVIERFSRDVMIREYEKLYLQLLEGRT